MKVGWDSLNTYIVLRRYLIHLIGPARGLPRRIHAVVGLHNFKCAARNLAFVPATGPGDRKVIDDTGTVFAGC